MSTDPDESRWRTELEGHREHKDDFFATDRQSPIPADQREAFDGLSYFDPDPEFRVEAAIDPIDGDETITMETTVETEQEYERVARLQFELGGDFRTLVAYSGVSHDGDSLFVPFRDKTTGQQTYGAGRYMEFEVDGELAASDAVTLDFNLAYHPFCAYNDAFACPLPPEENWLDAPIEAGEKLPES